MDYVIQSQKKEWIVEMHNLDKLQGYYVEYKKPVLLQYILHDYISIMFS